MLAVTIAVPQRGTRVHAAVADDIPVGELIPHLVDATPGEHWVLYRAIGSIAADKSLNDAGVWPGESLTLDIARAPEPELTAVEELTGAVSTTTAAWVGAVVAAVGCIALAITTVGAHPVAWHPLYSLGWAGVGIDPSTRTIAHPEVLVLTVATAIAALVCAALSLHTKEFVWIAALLGFATGLHVNVAIACLCAGLCVWRSGMARIITATWFLFALLNVFPGLTAAIALCVLAYSGHVAIGLARIKIPAVPATGVFDDTRFGPAGNVITVHGAVVIALMSVLLASAYQLATSNNTPPPEANQWWTRAGLLALALTGLSARGTRPMHAIAVTCGSIAIAVIALWGTPWVAIIAIACGLPAIAITSPALARIIDVLEAIAFCTAIPLLLATTGLFAWMRGLG